MELLHILLKRRSTYDIRRCDEGVVERLKQVRSSYPELENPWEHPSAQPYHQRIKEILHRSQALFIAGGHVAILRNRMNFWASSFNT